MDKYINIAGPTILYGLVVINLCGRVKGPTTRDASEKNLAMLTTR